jgi:Na+-transporting NADH:ubiquinone oxidoreductase subunit C
MSQQRESFWNTIAVALVLCVVCSLLVSVAAVALKDRQDLNKDLDRKKNILSAAGLAEAEFGKPANQLTVAEVAQLFERIEPKLVDLATGDYVDGVDPLTFDSRAAAKDPARSTEIADTKYDIGIKHREKEAVVYLVKGNDGTIKQLVLPVYGKGLWSTLYGFLSVGADGQQVRGLTFYEHAETPGLGGEVDNPLWKQQWPGRVLFDAQGQPAAGVAKGVVDKKSDKYMVDGLSGATITSRGVSNLVRYWISDQGFGPFLTKFREPSSSANGSQES